MTPEELEQIRQRAEAATPGPWRCHGPCCGIIWSGDGTASMSVADTFDRNRQANKEFIAHARQDVPALLTDVARLQADNERLRNGLTQAAERMDRSAMHMRVWQKLETAAVYADWAAEARAVLAGPTA